MSSKQPNSAVKLLTALEFITSVQQRSSQLPAIRLTCVDTPFNDFPLAIDYEYYIFLDANGEHLFYPKDGILRDQLQLASVRWNTRQPNKTINTVNVYRIKHKSCPNGDELRAMNYKGDFGAMQDTVLRVQPDLGQYIPAELVSKYELDVGTDATPFECYREEDLITLCSKAIQLKITKFHDNNVLRGIIGPILLSAGIKSSSEQEEHTAAIQRQLDQWVSEIKRPVPGPDGKLDTMDVISYLTSTKRYQTLFDELKEYVEDDGNGFDIVLTEDGIVTLECQPVNDLMIQVSYTLNYDTDSGVSHATIVDAEFIESPFGSFYKLTFEQYSVMRGNLERIRVRVNVSVNGEGIYLKQFVASSADIVRGSKLLQLTKDKLPHGTDPVSTWMHNGTSYVPGVFGLHPIFYYGPVVYDPVGCKQIETSTFNALVGDVDFLVDTNSSTKDQYNVNSENITDFVLCSIDSKVPVFLLDKQRWAIVDIKNVTPMEHDHSIFDKLVLDDREKWNIRSIVSNLNTDFVDIVQGKGGGAIFLLYGPPGLGKTLTAEAVSAVTGRVLYKVSVGELGTNVKSLEQSLQKVLGYATRWNATLLFDEADIFLEKRDSHNIERNAMVGVFLRLLEYYPGILFLTTNRVKNFDQAFFSRITYAIGFKEQTNEQRKKVWSNLLRAAKLDVTDEELTNLATFEVNNRQVKTSITNAQRFALSDGIPVTYNHLLSSLEGVSLFNKEITSDVDVIELPQEAKPLTVMQKLRQWFN